MRYMTHLVKSGAIGAPYHFRAARFQDWNDRNLGWRQVKKLAGSGEMGDMLSHRIDYGRILIGEYQSLAADFRRFLDVRQGNSPSDLDDWVSMIVRFDAKTDGRPVSGVLESTKLATGRGEGHHGLDLCEVNGSEGTLAYTTQKPLELLIGKKNDPDLAPVQVPNEFRVVPGSPRDPGQGNPLVTFRYDQDFEFIDAIRNQRPCNPSLLDGAKTQAIMDAAILSEAERRWVDVPKI
jgi:predicted dehydrogenase